MISVRIGDDIIALMPSLGRFISRVVDDPRGGYIVAEVCAVHTHECVSRRWGRRNHDKECNCGADELWSLMQHKADATTKET